MGEAAEKLSIAVHCALALAQAHATYVIVRASYPPAKRFDSSLIVFAALASAAIATTACAFDGPNGVCGTTVDGALTLSSIVAPAPWCATFAVALCVGAVGLRSALVLAGDDSIPTFTSILLFAAFPNIGVAAYFHIFFLFCISAASVLVSYRAAFGLALGKNATVAHRAHTFAAFATGLASLGLSFAADPGGANDRGVDLATLSFEVASIAHIVYAYV